MPTPEWKTSECLSPSRIIGLARSGAGETGPSVVLLTIPRSRSSSRSDVSVVARSPSMAVLYQAAPNASVVSSSNHARSRTHYPIAAAASVQPVPDQ